MGELNSKNRQVGGGRGRRARAERASAAAPPRLPGVKKQIQFREKREENYKERLSYVVLARSDRVCIELN